MKRDSRIERAYAAARELYAGQGIDTEAALKQLAAIPVSFHCWQGDDVCGFESPDSELTGGGIQVTGNYPGKARNVDELRRDLETAFALVPGKHRVNLHAIYLEPGSRRVERDEIEPRHFAGWRDWAKARRLGLDFNPSCFSHPKAADGFTLSHADRGIRQFWIDHCIASRRIGAFLGRELGTPCVTNVWVPDGYKDTPVDRLAPRRRLRESLDAVFAEELDPAHNLDALECKLFGIGSECYVVGSHEFYLGYAVANRKLLCLDAGHFHPTESVADKISAILEWVPGLLFHVSRGVRWDSDHVTTLSEETCAIGEEIIRSGQLDRIHIGLDFFDGSINRVAAWTIGGRSMQKALLLALLQPIDRLRRVEAAGDLTSRLALLEESKTMPFSAVWDRHCQLHGSAVGAAWIDTVKAYEKKVQSKRK